MNDSLKEDHNTYDTTVVETCRRLQAFAIEHVMLCNLGDPLGVGVYTGRWYVCSACSRLFTASLFSQIVVAASELELSAKRERGGRPLPIPHPSLPLARASRSLLLFMGNIILQPSVEKIELERL